MEHALRLGAVLTQDTTVTGERFEDFFELEHERLLRALYLVTGNRPEAEDIMQEAFVKVLERWDTVRFMDDPTGYLYRTAMNTFRKRLRRAKVAADRVPAAPATIDPIAGVDAHEAVMRALAGLSPRQRAAVVLTDLLGYRSEEAAKVLGIRASTVREHVAVGRAALRTTMGEAP
jgi:RNA polymerase sigma factor (sigma-70 family)